MVEIELDNVTKRYGNESSSEVAVDGISLTIGDGEFFSTLGPSGCGKTTTLRMIAGLETPTEGEIYFSGENVTNVSPQERDVAMVFQDPVLYPHMNIRENIGYGLKIREESGNHNEKIEEAAEMLEIKDQLDKSPSQLSGGQQQRVSLGAAIVRDPNVILFDEPLSDLDAKLKADLRVKIQQLHKRIKTTMIYVTHDQKEAMTMSTMVGLMNNGRIAQVDPPVSLYENPQSEFVASFIGQPSMNIKRASFVEDTEILIDGVANSRPVDLRSFSNGLSSSFQSGDSIHIGFRPHQTRLTPKQDNGIMDLTVDIWESLGANYEIHLSDEQGNVVNIVVDDQPTFEVGDIVTITHFDAIYLFDPKSGKQIAKGQAQQTKRA